MTSVGSLTGDLQRRTKDGPDIMARNFYILRDDRGRWVCSDAPADTGMGGTYRSYGEALDQLRTLISEKGLVMGKSYPEGTGFRVEANEPGEVVADPGPMLYSAEALNTAEAIRDWFGRKLKKHALDIAKREGRRTVTKDDVWAAFDSIDIKDSGPDSDEESDDGK